MSRIETPLVYALLGAAGSGRRELLADLILDGLGAGDKPVVLLAGSEQADDRDARLGVVLRWSWEGDRIAVPDELPADATHIFFMADGRGSPIDQIEALKPWAASIGGEVARVFTLVNCQ